MNKAITIIFIVVGLANCFGQEPSGVWMTYDNRTIYKDSLHFGGADPLGLMIDFDKSELSGIPKDTIVKIKLNFKKRKIKVESFGRKIRYIVYGKDSIKLKGTDMVFRPIELNHPLNYKKEEIIEYFDRHDFEPINEYIKDIEFIDTEFYFIEPGKKKNQKKRLISSYDFYGYWYIKEIRENFFLIFRLGQTEEESLYQILSMDEEKVKLKRIQEVTLWHELTELKTCL